MEFIPNSVDKKLMLEGIGLNDIDELFSDIPKKIRIKNLTLPNGLSQQDVEEHLRTLGGKNKSFFEMPNFLGGGIKPHYIPAAVKSIISRSEFYTSYTPYQPEASQGFLQAMFEYQSIIAEITGIDVSNASLYDGATAIGEAALMCTRINRRKTFVIPKNISRDKRSILKNYTKGAEIKIKEIDYDKDTGKIDVKDLQKTIDEDTSGIYIENPNFFGVFEDDAEEISSIVKDNKSLFVVGVDPLSLGIAEAPAKYGADIVTGEGRCFGNPTDFGGSTLGIFACKKEHLRQIPGRIIGMTKDSDGKRAFCMTMQTREQHIRRGRATSNICTNEGLNALAATVFLTLLGGKGLEDLSKVNFEKGQMLAKKIVSLDGYEKVFSGIHFNEFVIQCPDATALNKKLLENGIQGGLLLNDISSELKNCLLFGVTEMHDEKSIAMLLSAMKEVC
jgi:glycine dehydrogenase subunit 1